MRRSQQTVRRGEPRREERPFALRLVTGVSPAASKPFWRTAAAALRPHQWSKNLLLFTPFVLAHELHRADKWISLAAAFVIYSACASAGYLLNDLIDADADRRHPVKQNRPLASGDLPVGTAVALMAVLLAGAFAASAALMPWQFTGMVASYFAITAAYSVYLKRTLVLDVLLLAGLYTHRLLSGGIVAGVEVSQWLLSFSMFFFMSLALLKRYVELRRLAARPNPPENGRGYLPDDAGMLQTLGLASGCLSVLVLCLYISSHAVERLYRRPDALWLIAPALLYWISRIWILARRGEVAEDPLVAALKDPKSYLVGLACAAVLAAACVEFP
jgi:4-hydroxybenzoate polyprenyltransferase